MSPLTYPFRARYFGCQFGAENLFGVDRGTDDGVIDDPWDLNSFAVARSASDEYGDINVINFLQEVLLNYYGMVAADLVKTNATLYAGPRIYLEREIFDYGSFTKLITTHKFKREKHLELGRPMPEKGCFTKFLASKCQPCVGHLQMNLSPGFCRRDKPLQIVRMPCEMDGLQLVDAAPPGGARIRLFQTDDRRT